MGDNKWNSNHSAYLCENGLLTSRMLYDYRHPIDILDSLDSSLDSVRQRNNIMSLEPETMLMKINKDIVDNTGQLCNKNNLSRGMCAKCGNPVLISHSRYVNTNGQYCHKVCDNLYQYNSNNAQIPTQSPANGLFKDVSGFSSYTVLNSQPFVPNQSDNSN